MDRYVRAEGNNQVQLVVSILGNRGTGVCQIHMLQVCYMALKITTIGQAFLFAQLFCK
jgi:hypothetical protein